MTIITDDFDNPLGQYPNYHTEDINLQSALETRAHVDVRRGWADEDWTSGTSGSDPSLDNKPSLRVNLGASETVITTSVAESIDVSGLDPTYEISCAFPSFPAGHLDLTNSFVRFKSGATSVSLSLNNAFTASDLTYGSLDSDYSSYSALDGAFPDYEVFATTNLEAKWPLSALNLASFDTVELELKSIDSCVVTLAAIRILSTDWTATTMDIDTRKHILTPIVDRTGVTPLVEFPQLWRVSDDGDPMPVNSKLGILFYTGSNLDDNSIALFFRGRREDFLTMLDLDPADDNSDGILESVTMGDLDAYGTQPDYGRAMYSPRPQEDFDAMAQTQLDTYSQAYMERAYDTISESWIQLLIRFGANNDAILSTTEDAGILLGSSIPFEANTHYIAMTNVIDDSVRLQIFPVNADGSIDRTTLMFDSLELHDSFKYKRRKGRVGWKIDLRDGDSYIENIRSRGMMYGEWLSQNFESITPVEGARLYVGATPDMQTPLASLPFSGSTVSFDTSTKRSDDGSAKVIADTDEGLISHPVVIEDFENSLITFDIFYPQIALEANAFPELYVQNEYGTLFRIGMPGLIGDTWNHVEVKPLLASLQQTGPYSVLIKQDTGSSTFWVDNFTYQMRSVRWEGRSALMDPWGRNKNDWTDFGTLFNDDKNGIMFPERGTFVQVRGQTLVPNAAIDKLYIKPKYAELGRLTWNADRRYRAPNPGDTY